MTSLILRLSAFDVDGGESRDEAVCALVISAQVSSVRPSI